MEKPVESQRYALVMHKGHHATMKMAELRFYYEDTGVYVGKYIAMTGDQGFAQERDIPEKSVVARWDALPSLWVIDQAKRAVQQRLFRERERKRARVAS